MENRKSLRNGFILSLTVIVSFVFGVLSPLEFDKREDKALDIFEEIYTVLKDNWYYGDDEDMINRAIEALYTTKDDPFTFLMEPSTSVMDTVSGKGMGVTISDYGGWILIEEVYNGPNRVNLRSGDIITHVDGTSLSGKTFEESNALLVKAIEKPSFPITVLRDGIEKNVTIIVGEYDDNITVNLIAENEDYLALKIEEFGATTGTEFGKFLKDYGTADNLIIDLRGNPGGYITSVINVASYLMPNGRPVMSVIDRNENGATYKTSNESYYTFNHIYVMVDKDSASGAEALAITLKENAEVIEGLNVTVVGQSTYGKGTAQQDYKLSNGYLIHCTYAKWYSPNGVNVNGVGVLPTSGYELTFVDYEEYYYSYSLLKFEDQNDKVLRLQYMLKYMGYDNIRCHGFFDELTEAAVIDIQTNHSLPITGKVNLSTFNYIKRAMVDKKLEQSENEFNYVVGLIGD